MRGYKQLKGEGKASRPSNTVCGKEGSPAEADMGFAGDTEPLEPTRAAPLSRSYLAGEIFTLTL